jgi:DnaD/phage-associated family protein
MSVRVMGAVWQLDLDATLKIVLLKLADNADDDGDNSWPSVGRIAHECGVAERTVQRSIQNLMKMGLLVMTRPADKARKLPSVYRVVTSAGKKLPKYRSTPDSTRQHQMDATGDKMTPVGSQVPHSREQVTLTPRTGDTVAPDPSMDPSVDPPLAVVARARTRKSPKKATMTLDEQLARVALKELTGTIVKSVSEEVAAECKRDRERGKWIVAACADAAEQNARSWGYVKGILRRWDVEGFRAPLGGRHGRASGNNGRGTPPSRNGRSNADADREKQRAAAARGGEW